MKTRVDDPERNIILSRNRDKLTIGQNSSGKP
jgi:hypothetical protein